VRYEPLKGKGNVVRRIFADVEADIFIPADGDNTYDGASAPIMIEKLETERLDLVVGVRAEESTKAYRAEHRFGNRVLTGLVTRIFGHGQTDILSGYRVMSRRFVRSFPALSRGFEIETELAVHALEIRAPVGEIVTPYCARAEGSTSKLRTLRDGVRIVRIIAHLTRYERPIAFFGLAAVVLAAAASLGFSIPVMVSYIETGLVPRLPTWIFAIALSVLSTLSLQGRTGARHGHPRAARG
jgi:hypothetical protein